MLRNYFRIAYRNIIHHKAYSAINVLGLAIGISVCILIYLITSFEFSFDRFHPEGDRIYRMMLNAQFSSGDKFNMNRVPFSAVINARREITGLQSISGAISYNAQITIPGDQGTVNKFDSKIEGLYYPGTIVAEPEYFSIFRYNWLAGNATTALQQPFTVVLTQSKARKYFGAGPYEKMIGREVIYDDSLRVRVSGIVEDARGNTDFAFTDFISYASVQNSFLKPKMEDSWYHVSTWGFVKLHKNTKPDQLNAQLASLVSKYAPNNPNIKMTLWLEPLSQVHFDADVVENPIRTADLTAMYSLMGIAFFILVLAIVNFINLSTAQSLRRRREIGIRKVLGSGRISIIFQFLIETLLITLFAALFALFLVNPIIAAFQSFIPEGVTFHVLDLSTIVFLVIIILITCLLAGIYPARMLSSNIPALSLKGADSKKGGETWRLRKGLIVFQFAVSLVFIIGSLIIHRQLQYTRSKNMGFNADAIVMVPAGPGNVGKTKALEEKIKHLSGVRGVALQMSAPMAFSNASIALKVKSRNEPETRVQMLSGNEEYIPLYQMKLLAGRNLQPADSLKEYVINEACLRMFGFNNPADAIGKMLYYNDRPYPIVGVVADFNEKSFHETIKPACIVNLPFLQNNLAIRLDSKGKQTDEVRSTLSQIQKIYKEAYTGRTFDYSFFDETIALFYEKDRKTAKLMNTAMLITITISCIGLFGLVMFTAKNKTREIAIRKVFGASVSDIYTMLSRDFLALILISLLIASPLAWYFMNKWLQDFVYRIDISWWMFVLPGFAAMVIALATVSLQSVRAALANPVKSLRTE